MFVCHRNSDEQDWNASLFQTKLGAGLQASHIRSRARLFTCDPFKMMSGTIAGKISTTSGGYGPVENITRQAQVDFCVLNQRDDNLWTIEGTVTLENIVTKQHFRVALQTFFHLPRSNALVIAIHCYLCRFDGAGISL